MTLKCDTVCSIGRPGAIQFKGLLILRILGEALKYCAQLYCTYPGFNWCLITWKIKEKIITEKEEKAESHPPVSFGLNLICNFVLTTFNEAILGNTEKEW